MSKVNINELVTNRIIEQLENGIIPWEKPWTGTRDGAYSRSTGKPYSLLNQMMLKHTGEYLTYKQCQEAGGQVRKGEKSEIVVFYKPYAIKEVVDGKETTKTIPLLNYYNVFHVSQCDGIEAKYQPETRHNDTIEEAETIANDYITREGIRFDNDTPSNNACYSPLRDSVTVPMLGQFVNSNEYYHTLFHELIHSTGHKNRLDRISKDAHFGNTEYSKEELVAEIGAAGLSHLTNTEIQKTFKNSVAYIQNWLSALKNDKNMIVSAAGKAEKAINYILD